MDRNSARGRWLGIAAAILSGWGLVPGSLWGQVSEEWVARYNGPANADEWTTAVVVDSAGNVYVTGGSTSQDAWEDYLTIKYDPEGSAQWVARYNGPGDEVDFPSGLGVDRDGNVYVTGVSRDTLGAYDYATIKYDPQGNPLWLVRYNGPENGDDFPFGLALDGAGGIYVTGRSEGVGTLTDYATIRYDAEGHERWVARYNGPGNGYDTAERIALEGSGGVRVTGGSEGLGTAQDYATLAYDSGGDLLWSARYDGSGEPFDGDYGSALAVDGDGNVYVTGQSASAEGLYDYLTVKYDPVGREVWTARYDGPRHDFDAAHAVAVDELGNVYVTGYSVGEGTSEDCATIKYDPAGNELWVARYDGPGNGDDWAVALALDGVGNVYVMGSSMGNESSYDYATIKYDPEGREVWVMRYNGPGNKADYGDAMALDGAGNIYVTGGSSGSGTRLDYATIKYRQGPVGVGGRERPVVGLPAAFGLAANYPNPFNPSTTISYAIPREAARGVDVTLEVFSLRGERMATLFHGKQGPGVYKALWDGRNEVGSRAPSGVYLWRLRAGAIAVTRKVTLLR